MPTRLPWLKVEDGWFPENAPKKRKEKNLELTASFAGSCSII